MDITQASDGEILFEIGRRFEEKSASIAEMEFMTKKLLEMNEQTKRAEAIKGEFLSIIKNEFNNPLSTLLNFSNMLIKNPKTAKLEEMIKMMNMELLRLDFHFQNIFAATEIEAGEIANYYTSINFESLLEDVKKHFVHTIDEKNLKISFKLNLEEKFVSDSRKLYLIISNLLSNACEFSYPNSEIIIEIKEEGEDVIIGVNDTGEGVSVDFHAKIFDRFSKFSTGRTRAHTGLGLGLSIARGMAEALGGDVDFKSKAGETIFWIKLPKHNPEMDMAGGSGDSDTFMFDDFSDVKEL